jgi:DNA-directed RNA polymerase specialized sigma subunit
MTNREKITHLSRYVTAGLEYDEALESLIRYRSRIESAKILIISDMPNGGGTAGDKMAGHLATLERIEETVNIRLAQLQEMRIGVENIIGRVQDENGRRLLVLRYLEGFSWVEVAYRLNYGWTQTHRIHSKVLTSIKM